MKRFLTLCIPVLMVGCASTKPVETVQETAAPVYRYLAWYEGDYQSNYEPKREVAEEKLAQMEGKEPEATNTDATLEYLSLLSASGKSDAEPKIKKFLSENPNEKRGIFLLAVHYLRNKKRELASYLLNQLEQDAQFPWKSLLYNNQGMLALQDKNRNQALGYFEKAVKATPASPAPLVNLGALYLQSRSYKDALELFHQATELDPEFEDAALGYGVAFEGLGKFEEAQKVYAEYIEKNPGAVSVLYNQAIVLGNRLKRHEDAAQLMLRYIQKGGKETARAHEIMQTWR